MFGSLSLHKLAGFNTDRTVAEKLPPEITKLSFEEALAELKQIVESLEQGEGLLDDAIKSYERGAALKKHCEAKLHEAKQKIEKISHGPDGSISTEDFDVE